MKKFKLLNIYTSSVRYSEYESTYDLPHEFHPSVTERDETQVNHIFSYIVQKRILSTKELKIIVTEYFTETHFLFQCLSIGSQVYSNFAEERFEEKFKKLPFHVTGKDQQT